MAEKREPLIRWGLLGWSNKRPGLEFYRWDDRTIPRHGSEWGDLLVNAVDFPKGEAEGSPVLVIVLPQHRKREDLYELTQVIRNAVVSNQDTTPSPDRGA